MQFNSDPQDFHRQLNELATQIGARRIGVCSLDQDEALDYLDRWLAQEFMGEMQWMQRAEHCARI